MKIFLGSETDCDVFLSNEEPYREGTPCIALMFEDAFYALSIYNIKSANKTYWSPGMSQRRDIYQKYLSQIERFIILL